MEQVSQVTEEKNQNLNMSEYEAQMIAKAEGANDESMLKDAGEFSEEKETLLAGKYKSVEELEKAYAELQSKLGSKEPKEETPKEETPNEAPATEEAAKEAVESKGINFDDLNYEFAENGSLSEDTYKNLEKAGIPKSTVDAYIAGQQALVEQNIAKLQSLAGGESEYNAMIEWAAENLSDSEKEGFNQALQTEAGSQFAIQGLYARYKAQAEPNLVRGNANVGGTSGYQSKAEMMKDMASPQYKKDPAFRQLVQNKIAKSNI